MSLNRSRSCFWSCFRLVAAFISVVLLAGATRAAVVFSDNFSSSTVPIATAYPATTATSTGYAIASSKAQSPAPSISAGHLTFSPASMSSLLEQAQALFTTSPITLVNTNDYIEFTITFNETGILTSTSSSSGELDFGLFNSGGSAPKTDLSASGLLSTLTADAMGGVAGWQGYTVRILPTTSNSKMDTRPPQTSTNNSNQELLTDGASSSSYQNPTGAEVGTNKTGTNVILTDGQYTDDLVITLTGANQESIVNNLYSGPTIAGSPISTFSKTADVAAQKGSSYQTSTFDGMAFGWRETGNVASSMDVTSLAVSSNVSATPLLLGDVNGDQSVTTADVQAMMSALSDLNDYQGLKAALDVNQDGSVNNLDIQALLNQIANAPAGMTSLVAVPEPSSWVLLGLGTAMFCFRSYRGRRAVLA